MSTSPTPEPSSRFERLFERVIEAMTEQSSVILGVKGEVNHLASEVRGLADAQTRTAAAQEAWAAIGKQAVEIFGQRWFLISISFGAGAGIDAAVGLLLKAIQSNVGG